MAAGPRLSRRLDRFGAETVWQEFTPLAREMGAVNLGQGFPDWPTPAFVKDAMKRSQDEDHNQYCRSAGHPPLVQALAAKCVCLPAGPPLRARLFPPRPPLSAHARTRTHTHTPTAQVRYHLWAAHQLGD